MRYLKIISVIIAILLLVPSYYPSMEIQITYYNGRLIWMGSEADKPMIQNVILTVEGMDYTIPVSEDGSFSKEYGDVVSKEYGGSFSGYNKAIVSLPEGEYVIPESVPFENNIIFPSNVSHNQKDIYFSNLDVIEGRVTTYDESTAVAGALVTCYRKNERNNDWELWKDSILSPNAERRTDASGRFSYQVIQGEYRFQVQTFDYDEYDSFEYEYVQNNRSLINTYEDGTLTPTLHLSFIRTLQLTKSYPVNNQQVSTRDSFKLEFDKSIVQKSIDENTANLRLQLENGGIIPSTVKADGNVVTIVPRARLVNGMKYKIVITTNIKASDGSTILNESAIAFTAIDQEESGTGSNQGEDDPQIGGNEENLPDTEDTDNAIMADLEDHWAKDYIERLYQSGIVNGNLQEDGSILYYPENQITREEFAKLIISANHLQVEDFLELPFKDLDSISEWAIPYVAAAYEKGLMKGMEEENGLMFDPSKPITRAEIMTIIGRLFEPSNLTVQFADWEDVPDWAMPYVTVCVEKKLIAGYEENGQLLLKPLNNITRAEAATIIAKLVDINQNR